MQRKDLKLGFLKIPTLHEEEEMNFFSMLCQYPYSIHVSSLKIPTVLIVPAHLLRTIA